MFPSDLEIAQNAPISHIKEIAQKVNIDENDLQYYGKYKSKLPLELIDEEKIKKSEIDSGISDQSNTSGRG
jgi:formate--tetrahydrofolate ligase